MDFTKISRNAIFKIIYIFISFYIPMKIITRLFANSTTNLHNRIIFFLIFEILKHFEYIEPNVELPKKIN